MLHIRNDAFDQLGDHDLGDLKVEGAAPQYTLKRVEETVCLPDPGVPGVDLSCPNDTDPRVARDVKGTMVVPCYLDVPGCAPAHSQFLLDPRSGLPVWLPGNVMKVDFECLIPKRALAEGVSRHCLHMLNLPAGSDVQRLREQLGRMDRRLSSIQKELAEIEAVEREGA